jgi:cell wall-associated NlpC family hydrolase
MPSVSPSPASGSTRAKIVQAAIDAGKLAAGKPYMFGGKAPSGFDCSGFIAYVYHQVLPEFVYMDTAAIRKTGRFTEVKTALSGDLIFFPKGKNPYEVKKGNQREFPDHVGITLDRDTWIGSQSSTGVAQVHFSNPWWSPRPHIFLRYNGLAPA